MNGYVKRNRKQNMIHAHTYKLFFHLPLFMKNFLYYKRNFVNYEKDIQLFMNTTERGNSCS